MPRFTASVRRGWLLGRRLAVRLSAVGVMVLSSVSGTEARIVRLEIEVVESPTFEGRAFGDVGPYEKLRGRVYGEVDPADPRNAVITDIELAPRNARGMVEYSTEVYILKPVDLGRGNHTLFVDVNNRGDMRFSRLNGSPPTNDPARAADAGDAFLLERGYTLVANGWDPSAPSGNGRLTIAVPTATRPDGSAITGPSYAYFSPPNTSTLTYTLPYLAATRDPTQGTLTVRSLLNESPTVIPPGNWEFADDATIRLQPAETAFTGNAIYELTYTARDPVVAGLGFAATRDIVSFLRFDGDDAPGAVNPLAGDIEHTLAWTVSQPGRYLNDFQTLGFNEDERGRRVLDGIQNWVAAGTGIALNYRFAQPARTERNRQNHFYPEGLFPFAHPVLHDPVSGKTAGRDARCLASGTCPRVFEINSANEYWVKAGSLLHTDTAGNDLPDPEHVRFFLLSGTQHGGGSTGLGGCQQSRNPTDPDPALRALFVALHEWVVDGVKPPGSRVPRVSDGTAVFAHAVPTSVTGVVSQGALGFPDIPGVTYTGLITTRYLFDFGPEFDRGIVTQARPTFVGRPVYPAFVSRTDEDGNEVAGIRLPPVAAPVSTTTGWALRREGFGLNDGCEGAGQSVPFATTAAARRAVGDPRLSLEERYGTHAGYVEAVANAARQLMSERLLLEADVQRYIDVAENSDILR